MRCQRWGQAQLYLGHCSFMVYEPPMESQVWQPKPSWASVTYPGYSFVDIEDIVSRVVYSKSAVNFAGLIGTETVFVVVPYDV